MNDASRKRAQDDLTDIGALLKTEAFSRYWLRRLKDKRDAAFNSFLNDPVEKCDPAKREQLRQQVLFCDELLGMMKTDEMSARTLVEQP